MLSARNNVNSTWEGGAIKERTTKTKMLASDNPSSGPTAEGNIKLLNIL